MKKSFVDIYRDMYFLVDKKKKIIFGWSAKCGCTHVKKMWYYLNNIEVGNLHRNTYQSLPDDVSEYTILIFTRNPYKRLVSGFLDKYRVGGQFRRWWNKKEIKFDDFVNELFKNNWKLIERHHFCQQTSEAYSEKIFQSKILKFYDISKIDYSYIEDLYKKKLPASIIDFRGNHARQSILKTPKTHKTGHVYNLEMSEYFNSNLETKNFYNEDLKKKVFQFYKKDFDLFYRNGIDYINESL